MPHIFYKVDVKRTYWASPWTKGTLLWSLLFFSNWLDPSQWSPVRTWFTLVCTVASHAGGVTTHVYVYFTSVMWKIIKNTLHWNQSLLELLPGLWLADFVSFVLEYKHLFYQLMWIIMSFYTKLYEMWEKSNATM